MAKQRLQAFKRECGRRPYRAALFVWGKGLSLRKAGRALCCSRMTVKRDLIIAKDAAVRVGAAELFNRDLEDMIAAAPWN